MYRKNYVDLCLVPYVHVCVGGGTCAAHSHRGHAGGTRSYYAHAHNTSTESYSGFTHII
jgi:hypothetical protein